MTLLVDTHVFLWIIAEPWKLSARAAKLLRDEANELVLSTASLWEIALKVHTKRLELPATRQYFETKIADMGIGKVMPVAPHHIYAMVELPRLHKDPFDRMLAAQCLTEDMALVTADRALRKYPIEVVW